MAERIEGEIAQGIRVGDALSPRSTGVFLPAGGTIRYLNRSGREIHTTLSPGSVIRGVAKVLASSSKPSALYSPSNSAPGEGLNDFVHGTTAPNVLNFDAASAGIHAAKLHWTARPGWVTRVQTSDNGSTWRDISIVASGIGNLDYFPPSDFVTDATVYFRARHEKRGGGITGSYSGGNIIVSLPIVTDLAVNQEDASTFVLTFVGRPGFTTVFEYRGFSSVTGLAIDWTTGGTASDGVFEKPIFPSGGVERGMSYEFRARHSDGVRFSPSYSQVTHAFGSANPSGAAEPTGVTANLSPGDVLPVIFDWTPPTRDDRYALYTVERKRDSGSFVLLTTSGLNPAVSIYNDNDSGQLTPNHTFTYRIRYFWADGTVGEATAVFHYEGLAET